MRKGFMYFNDSVPVVKTKKVKKLVAWGYSGALRGGQPRFGGRRVWGFAHLARFNAQIAQIPIAPQGACPLQEKDKPHHA